MVVDPPYCVVCKKLFEIASHRGNHKYCPSCKGDAYRLKQKEQTKKWRLNHPEWKPKSRQAQNTEWMRQKRDNNPEHALLIKARERARVQNLAFSITEQDIKIPLICPVLGLELKRNIGGKSSSDNSPTLDQITPGHGYTPTNIQVISFKANTMKSNATVDQLIAFANWVRINYDS